MQGCLDALSSTSVAAARLKEVLQGLTGQHQTKTAHTDSETLHCERDLQ